MQMLIKHCPLREMNKTLYDKIWDIHAINPENDGETLLYIDRHFLHEVTSPQAFEGIEKKGLNPWRLESNVATPDHNVSTQRGKNMDIDKAEHSLSKIQLVELDKNCKKFRVKQHDINSDKQGIVHVIGPEQGLTLPGMTIVCGDSHTSTHGAFACLAMGIGTSEVEHVLATQCLRAKKLANMRINIIGQPKYWITPKDVILHIISKIGTAGGNGHAIEFSGDYIKNLSMEGRMTICNMSIEAGAKVGLVAYDQITESYIRERIDNNDPKMIAALKEWVHLISDTQACFNKEIDVDISNLVPQVSWGTSPEMTINFNDSIPKTAKTQKAIEYMGLANEKNLLNLVFDKVFVGSCTNSRIEDLRATAAAIKGRQKADNILEVLVVPGSRAVQAQAEKEGLDKIFIQAGFSWRDPGCSMCLGMNEDKLSPFERCASTSNRNFEGRQGHLGRTHLVSPYVAGLIAVHGHLPEDIKEYIYER